MSKALGIDFGEKRTGLAITDSLRIVASPLETVPTDKLKAHLILLVPKEKITTLVLGEARHADDTEAPITIKQNEFADWLRKQFPTIELVRIDERNTSQLAAEALYQGGMRKSQRQKKENLDKVSAAIILQLYLNA